MTSTPAIHRFSSSNKWVGRPYGPPIAFVLHTESGGASGTVAEFLNSSAQLSAHYSVGLDGTVNCYIDPSDRAWANGILEPGNHWATIAQECGVDPALNPNHVTIACETEDGGDPAREVPDGQYNAVLSAALEAKERYPMSLRYLARHADISPQSRPTCPGDRWVTTGRFQALADAVGLKTVSA
ncbi:MAG TPA: N-acetylmuramoyl-L-alanine amidase [Chloroflexota bacterium]|jgi:N-acetyl-anhydromuramyl-L-alanine amidase AmpD|nr:N-acetylmuramoyl-L-alanine amidase [Chloroflexota bacterium]